MNYIFIYIKPLSCLFCSGIYLNTCNHNTPIYQYFSILNNRRQVSLKKQFRLRGFFVTFVRYPPTLGWACTTAILQHAVAGKL